MLLYEKNCPNENDKYYTKTCIPHAICFHSVYGIFFILVEEKSYIIDDSSCYKVFIMFFFLLVVFNFFFLQGRPDIDDGRDGFSWWGALMGSGCLSKPISGMPLTAITKSFNARAKWFLFGRAWNTHQIQQKHSSNSKRNCNI